MTHEATPAVHSRPIVTRLTTDSGRRLRRGPHLAETPLTKSPNFGSPQQDRQLAIPRSWIAAAHDRPSHRRLPFRNWEGLRGTSRECRPALHPWARFAHSLLYRCCQTRPPRRHQPHPLICQMLQSRHYYVSWAGLANSRARSATRLRSLPCGRLISARPPVSASSSPAAR